MIRRQGPSARRGPRDADTEGQSRPLSGRLRLAPRHYVPEKPSKEAEQCLTGVSRLSRHGLTVTPDLENVGLSGPRFPHLENMGMMDLRTNVMAVP